MKLKNIFKRKKELSSVAGIVDKNGGIRVVVTEKWRMMNHVGQNERLYLVPNLKVEEPVAYGAVASLVDLVTNYVKSQP